MTPKLGDPVRFRHGEEVLSGIVNGPVMTSSSLVSPGDYVPVHVHDGNRNIIVHRENILVDEVDEGEEG